MNAYRENGAVNWSILKQMKSSPADYRKAREYPSETTGSMKLGTLVHAMLLEPETISDRYMVTPKMDMRSKENKEIHQKLVEEAGDKILVPAEAKSKGDIFTWDRAEAICEANKNKPVFLKLMASMEGVEKELYGECKVTGLKLKGLADLVTTKALVDIKTTSNISKLFYSIRKYQYLGQLAYYDYLLQLNGLKKEKHYIMFVETFYPYKLKLIHIDPRVIEQEHQTNLELLKQVKECEEKDNWPDGSDEILTYEYKENENDNTK